MHCVPRARFSDTQPFLSLAYKLHAPNDPYSKDKYSNPFAPSNHHTRKYIYFFRLIPTTIIITMTMKWLPP